MRLCRFYHPTPITIGSPFYLREQTNHHVVHVLRMQVGQEIILFDGFGAEYAASVTQLHKKQAEITVSHQLRVSPPPKLSLHLAQALSKKDTFDIAIQKAVELGVTEISPIMTEFTDFKKDKTLFQKKQLHIEQIVIQACEQCQQNYVPKVHPILSLTEWEKTLSKKLFKLYCDPSATASLNSLAMHSPTLESFAIVIGPEGGFSNTEISYLSREHFQSIRLGPRILRFETATIVTLGVIQALWGDLT